MKLSVKDVAALLKISEKTIYRMVQNETIPCFRVGGQWRFDRREIISWAEDTREFSLRKVIKPTRIRDAEAITIAEFIQRGGVYRDIPGDTKEAVISYCLETIQKTIPQMDAKRLFYAIMYREQLCSTAVGNGIALPHSCFFKELATPLSSIALCRLSKPIPFDALDNGWIDTLFFIFPKTESRFLRIQTKLLRLLKEPDLLEAFRTSDDKELFEILSHREEAIMGETL